MAVNMGQGWGAPLDMPAVRLYQPPRYINMVCPGCSAPRVLTVVPAIRYRSTGRTMWLVRCTACPWEGRAYPKN